MIAQFIGGHLDGQEIEMPEDHPEYHFPRLYKGFQWDTPDLTPTEEDIYIRLLDSSIYIYKGTR